MDFVKMQGFGNDFIVVDGPVDLDATRWRRWCDRRRGIGADGVLEVTPIDDTAVRMRYWNADGSIAEMCGNGLRCVARHAVERGWVDAARNSWSRRQWGRCRWRFCRTVRSVRISAWRGSMVMSRSGE